MIPTLNGREVCIGLVRVEGSTKDRPGWVFKDTGQPVELSDLRDSKTKKRDSRKYPPYTAQEWWLQERDNQLALAQLYHDRLHPEHYRVWECLFLWATPDLWRDPE